MSFKTVEVELKNGQVSPVGAETLPTEAHALLTIIAAEPAAGPSSRLLNGEVMRKYAGIAKGTHTDLSCNKSHLDDLGK